MYNDEVLKHFTNPRNVGEVEGADGVGVAGNIRCGDMMRMTIKVGDGGVIEDIKFKTLGCAAAIATSSKTTELAKGKTVEQALAITKKEIADSLGGLPPIKLHCSMLASDALKEAVYDYLDKSGKPVSEELEREHERIKVEREILEDTHH
jgi:nitrogen fixation NifU-like protein